MNIEVFAFDHAHPLGEPATHPIARQATPGCVVPARGTPDSYALKRYDSAPLPGNSPDAHSSVFN